MNKFLKPTLVFIFFLSCFFCLYSLNKTQKYASKLLNEITNITEKNVAIADILSDKFSVFSRKIGSTTLFITYYRTDYKNEKAPYDFAEIELKNISPFLCHFLIKNKNPIQLRLFVNNKERFFQSDSSTCFTKMNNTLHLYFELYNYTSAYHMAEPALCLSKTDCQEGDLCQNGYCKKITKQ